MANYQAPSSKLWTGRTSDEQLYLHEKIRCLAIDELADTQTNKAVALLGYCCHEGVRRNQGRIGAKEGPAAIRQALSKLPNHLPESVSLFDVGDVVCVRGDMEAAQNKLAELISELLSTNTFPIVLGGGHDLAFGHYQGIQKFLNASKKSVGIINFDAHFDLRDNVNGNNSGTPFFQIARDCEALSNEFKYLCLGIRDDANNKRLFETAQALNVKHLSRDTFRMQFVDEINKWITAFMNGVDHVYVTIDLDGFSSAFAPGVSAPSPMGFSPDIVIESLKTILSSGKLISVDFAEMNPKYDSDGQTAKLAASLAHYMIHKLF